MDTVLRELYRRMHDYKQRVGPLGDMRTNTLPSMVMLMADAATKVHFRKECVTGSLEGMRREVEALRDLHKPMRSTTPLNLHAFAPGAHLQQPKHEEYSQAEWDEWESSGAAEQERQAEREHLAAVGKAKGKGKFGKGKGKGKGDYPET